MIQPVEGLGQQWNAYCTGSDDLDHPECGVVQYGLHGQTEAQVADLWNRRFGGWVPWKIRKPTEADGPQVLYAWNRLHEVHAWNFKPRLKQNNPHSWMRIPIRNNATP